MLLPLLPSSNYSSEQFGNHFFFKKIYFSYFVSWVLYFDNLLFKIFQSLLVTEFSLVFVILTSVCCPGMIRWCGFSWCVEDNVRYCGYTHMYCRQFRRDVTYPDFFWLVLFVSLKQFFVLFIYFVFDRLFYFLFFMNVFSRLLSNNWWWRNLMHKWRVDET